MTSLRTCQAVLSAALLLMPRASASAGAPAITIELRVLVHVAIEPAALELARTSVAELLRSARIRAEWRECPVIDVACRTDDAAHAIVVRMVPTKLADSPVCGSVSPDGVGGEVIMIFLPCHEDLTRAVRTKAIARSEPSLATLEIGHLLGLTMAHEIGHVLGLAHAPVGVMQARFGTEDFLDLRTSRLAFMLHEQVRMRRVTMVRAGGRVTWGPRI
jgi:hypothetical protein